MQEVKKSNEQDFSWIFSKYTTPAQKLFILKKAFGKCEAVKPKNTHGHTYHLCLVNFQHTAHLRQAFSTCASKDSTEANLAYYLEKPWATNELGEGNLC